MAKTHFHYCFLKHTEFVSVDATSNMETELCSCVPPQVEDHGATVVESCRAPVLPAVPYCITLYSNVPSCTSPLILCTILIQPTAAGVLSMDTGVGRSVCPPPTLCAVMCSATGPCVCGCMYVCMYVSSAEARPSSVFTRGQC